MPKKIKIFTEVPLTTMGDAMAARKLIHLFQDEQDIEIEWVVVRDNPIEDKDITSIPNGKVVQYSSWDEVDTRTYADADAFIIYPHIPFEATQTGETLDASFVGFLERLPQDKTVLTCTEYNSVDIDFHRLVSEVYPFVQRLNTGFGELGVYTETQKNPKELFSEFKTIEPEFSSRLFGSQSEEKYFSQHHLYFGYLNTAMEDDVSGRNKVDRESFVLTCIRDALREQKESKKDIDIVVPVDEQMLPEILKNLTEDEYKQFGDIVSVSQGKAATISSGNGINLRVINPFPLKHAAMLYLIAESSLITMCTGDQSFTEALTYNKLCFYQIMDWKEGLYEKFLKEVEKFCIQNNLKAEETPLYQFYSALYSRVHRESIRTFYLEHKAVLQEQQKLFGDYLKRNFNLNETFVPAIKKTLNPHPLLKASALGDEKSISVFLSENKLSPKELNEICDSIGNTPLLLAARKKHYSCMVLLMRAGADFEVVNRDRETVESLVGSSTLEQIKRQIIMAKEESKRSQNELELQKIKELLAVKVTKLQSNPISQLKLKEGVEKGALSFFNKSTKTNTEIMQLLLSTLLDKAKQGKEVLTQPKQDNTEKSKEKIISLEAGRAGESKRGAAGVSEPVNIKQATEKLKQLIRNENVAADELKAYLQNVLIPNNSLVAAIDTPDEKGDTPMMAALKSHQFDKAAILLNTKLIDVDKKNLEQISPLEYAQSIPEEYPAPRREKEAQDAPIQPPSWNSRRHL